MAINYHDNRISYQQGLMISFRDLLYNQYDTTGLSFESIGSFQFILNIYLFLVHPVIQCTLLWLQRSLQRLKVSTPAALLPLISELMVRQVPIGELPNV